MKRPKFILLLALLGVPLGALAADKKIVLIAGRPSHGPGQHEHRAGCLLFQKCLAGFPGVNVVVYDGGWPSKQVDGKAVDDNSVFDDAAAIVIYSDGGGGHPALARDHLEVIGRQVKRGAGFGCIHYAVEPTIEKGQPDFLDWIGGAFEINWSVNPHWDGNFKQLPVHAVTRGVQPFTTLDEWYFNMRFRAGMMGVTPILTDVPPATTMSRKDDPHAGNPAVREQVSKGVPQHVMWVAENANGSRGFGFCGGHFHASWQKEDQRKLVLNAIVWLAKVEVPQAGVASRVSDEAIAANLDPKPAPAAKKKKS